MFQYAICDNVSWFEAFVLKDNDNLSEKESSFADFVLIFYGVLLCRVEKK